MREIQYEWRDEQKSQVSEWRSSCVAAEVPWIQGRVDHWILIVPFASSFYQGQVPDLIVIPVPVKVKLLSRVRLFVTPWTVAYQAPPSMGFSRQEYWSGLPFPSPGELPNPGIEPGLPHCRQTLYLRHQGSHSCTYSCLFTTLVFI